MKNDFGRSDSHLGSHFANSKLVFLQNWESITDFMRIVAIPPIYVLFFFLFFSFVTSLHFLGRRLFLTEDQQWFVFNRSTDKTVAQTRTLASDQTASIGQVASDAARNFLQK